MKRLALTFAIAFALTGSAGNALASSPKAFDDDYDAALAVSGDTQWLIVGGVDKHGSRETYGISAFVRSGSGPWKDLPPFPGKHFNSSYSLHAVVQGTTDPEPCFLYPLDTGPRLECLRNGAWESALGSQLNDANIEDLTAPTPDSMALVYLKVFERQDRVLTYVTRSVSGGPWQQVGDPFEGIIIAQFAESDGAAPLRLGIEFMEQRALRGRRYVVEDTAGGWVSVTPTDRTLQGPFVGGPVVVAGTTYFPFTDASLDPFQFGVLSLAPGAPAWTRVGGGTLSNPKAAGQGSVAIADGAPWAIWQEDRPRGRSSDGSVRIANLADPTVTPIDLWGGRRIGPGPLDLADAPGPGMYALYAQGTRKGLRIVVDDVTP